MKVIDEELKSQCLSKSRFMGGVRHSRKAIREFISSLRYPVHLLDLGTLCTAIPLVNGATSWSQMEFGFALYEQQRAESHTWEFAVRHVGDPRKQLADCLLSATGEAGSVIVWNTTAATQVLRLLATYVPECANRIGRLNGRLVELIEPIRAAVFAAEGFRRDLPIGFVLPILCPRLLYDCLDVAKIGTDLSLDCQRYVKMNMSEFDWQKLAPAVRAGCTVDTYAEVVALRRRLPVGEIGPNRPEHSSSGNNGQLEDRAALKGEQKNEGTEKET